MSGVFRQIPYEILGFRELGVPPVVETLCNKPRGLVLVTGPTGSGKSTTLATMIDKINREQPRHIVTIEDPIEFLHTHKRCIVNQRELHADTHSFPNALRAVLREDPDVVLVGEMRDLETMESALRIAETGHLTFATLHTNSAVQTMNRIIDAFPANQQPQVRAQLSFVLEGILCQTLLPRASGAGPVPGDGDPDPDARDPEPHPRGQAPPDLLDDADGPEQVRHADVQPVARDARPPPRDLAGARRLGLLAPGRADRDDPARRRRRTTAPRATGTARARGAARLTRRGGGRHGPVRLEREDAAGGRRPAASSSPTRRTWRSPTSGGGRSTSRPSRRRGRSSPIPKVGPGKVNAKRLAIFTRQFSVMIDAGLPLVQCLEILGGQQDNRLFQKIILAVRQDVEAGSSLAEAMRKHPKAFDDLFVNMVAAGEAGGILDTILRRLSTYIEKAVKLKGQVKTALIYPVSVLSVAAIVVFIILWKVIPTFAALFAALGAQLPLPTRIVIAASNFVASYIIFIVAAIVRGRVLPDALLRDLPRPAGHRRHRPEAPRPRRHHEQDRRGPVLPHPRDADLVGRPDSRRPRDHGPDGRKRDHRGRHHGREQVGRGRAHDRRAARARRRSSRRWSSR